MIAVSNPVRTAGAVLISIVGLLNFHVPHFLIERGNQDGAAARVLELALLANVLAAVIAAVGIHRNRRWAWLLGALVATVSVALYLAQETVGLPGLPKMWLEPSRLVSLALEGAFVALAWAQLIRTGGRARAG